MHVCMRLGQPEDKGISSGVPCPRPVTPLSHCKLRGRKFSLKSISPLDKQFKYFFVVKFFIFSLCKWGLKGCLVVKFDIASPTSFHLFRPVFFCQPESEITWQRDFSVFLPSSRFPYQREMDLSTIIQFLLRTLIDKDMILCLAFASSLVREISCKVLETQVHHCGFCIVVQLIHRPMKREHTNKQFKTYGFCQSQLILLHQRKRAKGAFYRRPSVHCIASLPSPVRVAVILFASFARSIAARAPFSVLSTRRKLETVKFCATY